MGGGLTGCAAGVRVLGERHQCGAARNESVGRGSTGLAAGWIGGDPGVSFVEVEKALGRAAARDVFRSWRRAALDFASLDPPSRHQVRVQAQDAAIVAVTPDQATPSQAANSKARRDAGIDAPLLSGRIVKSEARARRVAAPSAKGRRRARSLPRVHGPGAEAAARGAKIFERSAVRQITFGRRKAVSSRLAARSAPSRARCDGDADAALPSLIRHFWFRTRISR